MGKIMILLVSISAVYVLTEYGISKGVPSPFSFIVVLASLFGFFVLKMRV